MNKILVTGLALGRGAGVCTACNFDLNWLIQYPSVLLWSDKIIVPNTIWEVISEEKYPSNNAEIRKSLKLIFGILRSNSLIEIGDQEAVLTSEASDLIFKEIETDNKMLPRCFPDQIRMGDGERVPGQIFIDGHEYCAPHMWSIYATLLLSRAWQAEPLFRDSVFNFARYKFGAASLPSEVRHVRPESFRRIGETFLPNDPILPNYAINRNLQCTSCAHSEKCDSTYLSQIESRMDEILRWRSYDEIQQMKGVIERTVAAKEHIDEIVTPDEIIAEFQDERLKAQRRVHSVFPKVKRWANLSTIVSIPVALVGLASGVVPMTMAGAAIAGISQITKEAIDYMSSKNSWLAFINSATADPEEKG